jgi:excisionase family DNA binding protein
MNAFGQKGVVPLAERLSMSPEEASALTGFGLTTIRQAISDEELIGRKKGTRVIVLQDDLKTWLKSLPPITGKKMVSTK